MTDKLRDLIEDVRTVYEGKGMLVSPNSFDRLRTEIVNGYSAKDRISS